MYMETVGWEDVIVHSLNAKNWAITWARFVGILAAAALLCSSAEIDPYVRLSQNVDVQLGTEAKI